MTKIRTFNGGLHTALYPALIQQNEAAKYLNCDHVPGYLGPVNGVELSVTGAKRYGHRFSLNKQWYWSDTPKDYIEYREKLYIGNRQGKSTKIVNGEEYNLGIEKPEFAKLEVQDDVSFITSPILQRSLSPGGLPNDTIMQYKILNYHKTADGFYVSISPLFTINTGDKSQIIIAILLANLEIRDYANVYREYEGEFYYIGYIAGAGAPGVNDSVYDISGTTSKLSDIYEWPDTQIYDYDDREDIQYVYTFYNANEGVESAPRIGTGLPTVKVSGEPFINAVNRSVSCFPVTIESSNSSIRC